MAETARGAGVSASAAIPGEGAVLDAEVRVEVGAIVSLTIPECLSGRDFATALERQVLPAVEVIGNFRNKLTGAAVQLCTAALTEGSAFDDSVALVDGYKLIGGDGAEALGEPQRPAYLDVGGCSSTETEVEARVV